MPKPSIEFLNARRALKPASGGSIKDWHVDQIPERELDPSERLELECDSKWSDLRINSQAYWDKIFAQFGLQQGYDIGETF